LRNIRWIEAHCHIPEGKYVGRAVKLTAQQKHWIRRIYDSPTRLFILSMGRKNAKTSLAAFLLLMHLCGPEAKANSQLYSTAQSRDQAALLFALAAKIVRMSPALSDVMVVRDTAKQLACPALGTFYRALSAEASTAFGLSPSFVVHDELGQVRGPRSELYEALETACAAQESPLSIIISTQAPSDSDLLSVLIDDGLSGSDPRMKIEVYSAPMELDPFSEEAIRAANPHYDAFMNRAEVLRQAADAKRMPSREAAFRNLILNQRVQARNPFVSRAVWEENGAASIAPLRGAEVFGGLDLSSVADLTALILISKQGETWDVHPTFWLPEEGLAEKSRADRVPYDLWAQQGSLQTTPGSSIEYEFIAEHLRAVFDICKSARLPLTATPGGFSNHGLSARGLTRRSLPSSLSLARAM
jgi:phage terminase large subunit-like protein